MTYRQVCKCGFETELKDEMNVHLTNKGVDCGVAPIPLIEVFKDETKTSNAVLECGFCDVEPLDEQFLWQHLRVVHGEMPGLIPPVHYQVEEYLSPHGALLYKKITRVEGEE